MTSAETQAPAEDPSVTAPELEMIAEIRRELHRGSTFAATLPAATYRVLSQIVSTTGITEPTLNAAIYRVRSFVTTWRTRRAVEDLVARRYVRRDQQNLIPTVAGIGALHPFIALDSDDSILPMLRSLRTAERERRLT